MVENSGKREDPPYRGTVKWIATWIKICVAVLLVLVVAKFLGVQVFVEIELGDEPILAALTDIETYYLPLGLLLVFFLAAWIWNSWFGRGDG